MTDLSSNSCTTATLGEANSAIGKALAGGHLPSVAGAIMEQKELCDMVFQLFMEKNNFTYVNLFLIQKSMRAGGIVYKHR